MSKSKSTNVVDNDFLLQAKELIESFKNSSQTEENADFQNESVSFDIESKTIELAGLILSEADLEKTPAEADQQAELARMMDDPVGKTFTTAMTDQCFRSNQSSRVADQVRYLLELYNIPSYPSHFKKLSLRLFKALGGIFHWAFVPLTKHFLREETSSLIMPGEQKALANHMQKRRKEGVRINLNHLGEAILGEEEARSRLNVYLNDLENPLIDYISVKISTLYSQINLIAWENTLEILSDRYRELLRAAANNDFIDENQNSRSKFVNLDMEEYRDLRLTVDLFKQVLDEEEFLNHSAGIVLQAYLPDSFALQKEITDWAHSRVARGGAPIKIRIVKGANLSMEKVESSLKGWPQAPFVDKSDVDANYKQMIDYGLLAQNASTVRIGVGSHNLFDIAYSMLLSSRNGTQEFVVFEMLEGMADHLRRVVQKLTKETLLYCPAAKKEEFQTAVAYLVRRLDENTAPENFLRNSFGLKVDSAEWIEESERFRRSCAEKEIVGSYSRKTQNRNEEGPKSLCSCFLNEPDTDFSLPVNRLWAQNILNEWKSKVIKPIPLVIEDKERMGSLADGYDPMEPGIPRFQYSQANTKDLEEAIQQVVVASERLSLWPVQKRVELLKNAANGLRAARNDLIGVMVLNTGKTVIEADVEISEAIDFADYYASNLSEISRYNDVTLTSKGPILVLSPWNFPCSIPAGGIFAGLATGSGVLFKPAPEAVLVGWYLAEILWKAGIPKEFLQFIPCKEDPEGSKLVSDTRIKTIILTGATSTAKKLNQLTKGFRLLAETGGKNAIIVSNMSDRDLAIKDIVQSAFGHAGQKCSACSVVVLLDEVYNDPQFKKQLIDAATSLKVGYGWDPATKINPLITAPSPHLKKAIDQLEPGEEWLLKPSFDAENNQLLSPGIKWGVKRGSFMHKTEFFAPIVSVISSSSLDEAIEIANDTPYGLTSGIHSLDPREVEIWQNKIVAGNLYVNRGITGAIVERQPFGGTKDSQLGLGAKAGGANYLLQLLDKEQKELPQDIYDEALEGEVEKETEHPELLLASLNSYHHHWKRYFSRKIDSNKLIGQDNIFYYVPYPKIIYRVSREDRACDVRRIIKACEITNTPLEISFPTSFNKIARRADDLTETEEEFISRLKTLKERPRIRMTTEPSDKLEKALKDIFANVHIGKVLANGRFELLNYLREVSISIDYHRYGYLGNRENEIRSPLCSSPYDVEEPVFKAEKNCDCEMSPEESVEVLEK